MKMFDKKTEFLMEVRVFSLRIKFELLCGDYKTTYKVIKKL